MTEPRSTAQEAGDPSTSPERLLELTEKHPQLHRLIVQNPSCPDVARQWILATNPWAKRAYEESPGAVAAAPEDPEGATPAAAEAAEDELPEDEDREDVSVWGDLGLGATAAAVPQERPEEAPTPSVRIAQNSSVVPLGSPETVSTPPTPASPASAAPAPGPVAAAAVAAPTFAAQPDYTAYPDHGVAPAPGERPTAHDPAPAYGAAPMYGTAAVTGGAAGGMAGGAAAGSPPEPVEDDGSRTRRRTLFACGGCLVLALLLILGLTLLGRAWLGGDEEEYQRDSSTTAAEESPSPEPTEEPTEEETTPDPVSPAPEGAREMSALRSPTGNISCLLEEDSVSCSVLEHDYSGSGAEGCESGPFSITVAGGNPSRACGSSFLDDSADTLEYDDSAVHGNMACTSRFDGMTCWNTLTGKGFMVNRSTYETF